MENNCGIYCFCNLINGSKYIGKSINIKNRKSQHLNELRKGSHHSHYFQNTFNKYGEDSFIFGVIEYCNVDELDFKEKYYIDLYDTYNNGFNEQIPNGKNSGHLFTAADRAKHSIAIRKARLKWTAEDWARNKEYLDRGRATSMLQDRRLPILLYDCKTFEFKYRFNNSEECAKFLQSSVKAIEKNMYKIRHNQRLSYKGFILLIENNMFSIDDYLKSRSEYCNEVVCKKAIRSGLTLINRFNREYNHKIRIKNNYENKCKSWRENSMKSVDSLRKSGKYTVDIYKFDTGEYIGRWGLISDFAKEYNLNVKYLRRAMCGDQRHHKNYVVMRVN